MPDEPESQMAAPAEGPRIGGSGRVGAGILLSRLAGVVREAVAAAVFGAGGLADVLAIAFRGPNVLQNLLGEQTLSAAFIPIYSRLLEEGREEDAGRFAGAIFGLLLAVTAGLVLAGAFFARPFVAIIAPGFLADAASGATLDRYELAVLAVRILFPMTGLLVLSAWALGVLNSHRRFFLPYFAPVLWNASIVAGLLIGYRWLGLGGAEATDGRGLVLAACFGALVGGAVQFGVQLPLVGRLLRGFRLSLSTRVEGVRKALSAVAPVIAGRGAAQLSAYVDIFLVSFLAAGAAGALRWAQILYLLPIGLFAVSVAAAELPELSRAAPGERDASQERSRRALRQIAFLVVPTTVGYLAFGFLVVGTLYRRGSFGLADNWLVYLVLCGYALGLLATAWSRLLQNVFYSVGETRRPAAIGVARVVLSAALGLVLMRIFDRYGVAEVVPSLAGSKPLFLGALGLSLAAGLSAWVEIVLLRRGLSRLLPEFRLPVAPCLGMAGLALAAAVPAAGVAWVTRGLPTEASGLLTVAAFAAVYLGAARAAGVRELDPWLRALSRVNPRGA